MKYKIIDFHTHPYIDGKESIFRYADKFDFGIKEYKNYFISLGIEKICGTPLSSNSKDLDWNGIKKLNDEALKLRDVLGDFYIPGYHISAKHVDESLKEVERMQKEGVNLIGELLPYVSGRYFEKGYKEIFSQIEDKGIVVSFHSTVGPEDDAGIDEILKDIRGITFVAAHFGEYDFYMKNLKRAKEYDNYYLDTSGSGSYRLGAIPFGIKEVGLERFLFGSDFPTLAPSMAVGTVEKDPFLTEKQKQAIFYDNAKKLLKI